MAIAAASGAPAGLTVDVVVLRIARVLDRPASCLVRVSSVVELGSTEGVETAVETETGVVGVITVVNVGG